MTEGYTPLEFVGPLPDYLEQVRVHWVSLGVDTTVVEGLQAKVAAGGRTGNHQYVEHLVEATQFSFGNIIAFDLWRPGDRRLIDIVVPTDQVPLWQVPLTTTETAEVYATQRQETLVLPTKGGISIVKARSPIFSIGGYPKPVPEEGEPDFPEPPEWYQRTPGLEPVELLPKVGTIERIGDDRYVCNVAQTSIGGVLVNYFAPDALNGGWYRVAADGGLDPWSPGTYQLNAERAHEGEDWRNLRDPNTQAFAPGTTGSGWVQLSNRPGRWYDMGLPYYPATLDGAPMRVVWPSAADGDVDYIWRNDTPGNSWQPGVALWAKEGPA